MQLSRFISLLVISLISISLWSQKPVTDSLINAYDISSSESEKANLAITLSRYFINVDNDKSFEYAEKAIGHATNLKDDKLMARAVESKASVYTSNGNFKDALTLYLQILAFYETIKDYKRIASNSNNIANIYLGVDDYPKAESYFQRSYDAGLLSGDTNAIAVPLIGLSILYENEGKVQEAYAATLEATPLFEGIQRIDAMIVCYVNAAAYAYQLGMKTEARAWLDKAKEANTVLNNRYYSGSIMVTEAEWLADEGRFGEAIAKGRQSIIELEEVFAYLDVMNAHKALSEIYSKAGLYHEAYETVLDYIAVKDSLNELNKAEIMEEMSAKYEKAESDMKIAELSHVTDMQQLENKKNRTIIYIVLACAVVMLILVILAFIAYSQKRKTARALQEKNIIIEVKNREILDSIQYAKRIQDAIIPSEDYIDLHLKDSFVYYRPKDIVAGDFYWMETVGENVLLAVADCTGHGVPGAMVSVVCNNALNRAVREFKLIQPAKILDKTRELVVETFAQSQEMVRDGMDITLCSWNKKTNEVQWAGANNPLYILRKDASEIDILEPDKQPIGNFDFIRSYTNHSVHLNSGDAMYLFSDGFADQFGGVEGKKYKYGQFREFLLSHFKKQMKEQEDIFEREFQSWKGDLEQLDDICIIGVRV